MKKILLFVFYHLTIFAATFSVAEGLQRPTAHPAGELASTLLAENGKSLEIRAFDVAPDGNSIGVLYETWNTAPPSSGIEVWLARWDRSSQKIAWKAKLAVNHLWGSAKINDRKDLIFTNDQSRLVALGLGSIWTIDARGGTILSQIDPQSQGAALGGAKSIKALTGALVAMTFEAEVGFYTQILDLASGKRMTGWPISAIPESFSPDGKQLIAVSPGEWNKGGVVGLQTLDSATGAKLKSIAVGFGFKKRDKGESGGVIAHFVDNEHIVVAPDHMIDHTGNHSGYDLEIIDIVQNRVVADIKPEHFVPAGLFVISADRTRFAVFSIYASAWAYHIESMRHNAFRPALFLFKKDNATPELIIPDLSPHLPGSAGDAVRLSSNGSVFAVATGDIIKVFQIVE